MKRSPRWPASVCPHAGVFLASDFLWSDVRAPPDLGYERDENGVIIADEMMKKFYHKRPEKR